MTETIESPWYCNKFPFFQAAPAAYLERIRPDLDSICPPDDVAELQKLAAREDELNAAGAKFSREEAIREHETTAQKLRGNPTSANIEKLKNLGSLQSILHHYGIEEARLGEAALAVRNSALPIIIRASLRLTIRLDELAEQAAADEFQAFKDWGVPPPADSRLMTHIRRCAQDVAENCRRETYEVPNGVGIRGFLRILGIEKS